MIEIVFLSVLALVWIIFAIAQDLKTREVANWVNFSLIIFALGFRFFYCLFSDASFNFFYQGLIGLGIFLVLGNLLYYMRMFAGGDAKLMIALGAVLPFSESILINLRIFTFFFFIFLIAGGVYGFIWSGILSMKNFKNFKKEFYERFTKSRKLIYLIMFLGLCLMFLGFFVSETSAFFEIKTFLFGLGILIFVLPYFYLYAKAVDEVCMVKKIKTNKLTEGDWLYKDVRIGGKVIKANWSGLTKQEINLIKKRYREIKIKQGIPFTPVFLISFLILIYLWFDKGISFF